MPSRHSRDRYDCQHLAQVTLSPRQHVARRFGELLDREGLGQEGDVVEVDRLAQLLLGIARHEQDRQVGIASRGRARTIVGPSIVGMTTSEISRSGSSPLLEQLERRLAIARRSARYSPAASARARRRRGPCPRPRPAGSCRCPTGRPASALGRDRHGRGSPRRARVDGQVDGEGRRPAPASTVGEDEAARLLDDAVDGREAEPGALADFLGGEERLEDLAAGCRAGCRCRCRRRSARYSRRRAGCRCAIWRTSAAVTAQRL